MEKAWLYLWKILRSFYNGAFGSSLVYFFFHTLNFQRPHRVPLAIFAALLINTAKSKLLDATTKAHPLKSLLYSFFLTLAPLLALSYFHLGRSSEGILYVILISLATLPVDGEDPLPFAKMEQRQLTGEQRSAYSVYSRTGVLFQALGSLLALGYLHYRVEEVWYVREGKSQLVMNVCLFLALLNFACYTLSQLHQLDRPTPREEQEKSCSLTAREGRNLRALAILDGFSSGLLPAPFILYYLDLRMNFSEGSIALVVSAFFLLKGLGEGAIAKYQSYQPVFRYWSILSSILIALTPLTRNSSLCVLSLLLAFPVWHFTRAMREGQRKWLDGASQESDALWQRVGGALGVLASSFFFTILSTSPYFGYPLLLYGLLACLKVVLAKLLLQAGLGHSEQVQLRSVESQALQQGQSEEAVQMGASPRQVQRGARCLAYALLNLGFACFFYLYLGSCYSKGTCDAYRTKSDRVVPSPQLKSFNQSLAHLLLKENATAVKLIDCDASCTQRYLGSKEPFYDRLTYGSPSPSWLHFPNLPYFQAEAEADSIEKHLAQNPTVKGFSLMWPNPLLYNRMPPRIEHYLIALAEGLGFYYSEIPSLSLRGVEWQMVMVFGRERRGRAGVAGVREPPRNVLGIEVTFKLVTHYRYLREYILHHLSVGVDKFFLYDNNREAGDPLYFQEYHRLDEFMQQCTNPPTDALYAVLQEVLQDFYGHVIYIPWRIRDIHPQGEAHLHYRLFYQNVVTFTSFTDLDEYLFSPSGQYIPDTLQRLLQEEQVTMTLLSSRSFLSRICMNGQLSTEQYRYLQRDHQLDTVKSLGVTRLLLDHAIHEKSVSNGRYLKLGDQNPDIFFVHFTIYTKDSNLNFQRHYASDYSLRPSLPVLKEACRGKCSDTMALTCSEEEYQARRSYYCSEE